MRALPFLFRNFGMKTKNRIWEIDLLRGLLFISMAFAHAIYDIDYIFGYYTNFFVKYYNTVGMPTALLFMLLCGISCNLSKNPVRNGLKVFGIACCMTVVTGIVDDIFAMGVIINFGILHMLGIAMIVCGLLKKAKPLYIFLISLPIFIADYFINIQNVYWLFPLGFHTRDFYSADYYPLLPYVGIVLLGFGLGKLIYKEKKSLFPFSISGKDPISFVGRHSLVLYVVHQPVVLVITYGILELLRIAEVIQ